MAQTLSLAVHPSSLQPKTLPWRGQARCFSGFVCVFADIARRIAPNGIPPIELLSGLRQREEAYFTVMWLGDAIQRRQAGGKR